MNKLLLSRLRQAPLLSGLELSLLERMVAAGEVVNLQGRHNRLFDEDLSRYLYFVVAGEVSMLQLAPDGGEYVVQRFAAGDFFCLAALTSGNGCRNHALSSGQTQLLFWRHKSFLELMQTSRRFSLNLLSQIGCQINRERELHALSRCCRSDVRVAAWLQHRLAGSQTGKVNVKPLELSARELGLARETLTRCLTRLASDGVIDYQHGLITLLDGRRLEALSHESGCSCQRA